VCEVVAGARCTSIYKAWPDDKPSYPGVALYISFKSNPAFEEREITRQRAVLVANLLRMCVDKDARGINIRLRNLMGGGRFGSSFYQSLVGCEGILGSEVEDVVNYVGNLVQDLLIGFRLAEFTNNRDDLMSDQVLPFRNFTRLDISRRTKNN